MTDQTAGMTDSSKTQESKLGGMTVWVNWVLGVAFVVFLFTFQTGYAVTSGGMSDDLMLTVAQVGFIGSLYTWAFAIAQFASGSILDKLGILWVLPITRAAAHRSLALPHYRSVKKLRRSRRW